MITKSPLEALAKQMKIKTRADKKVTQSISLDVKEQIKIPISVFSNQPLPREFYQQDTVTLAKALVGKILVRNIDNNQIRCRIVETEAYCGITDKACHSYNDRNTERTKWLYKEGGSCYVYVIYGLHYLLNITSGSADNPSAVLIRAVEPIDGLELVKQYRGLNKISTTGKELTNGPGKFCQAMNIDKTFNGHDITNAEKLYIVDDNKEQWDIEITKRINIDYAGDDKHKPWRFYIKKNIFVSVK
jgi:DNA-3-methyladenine glycosylase